jgi:hypothetical protein
MRYCNIGGFKIKWEKEPLYCSITEEKIERKNIHIDVCDNLILSKSCVSEIINEGLDFNIGFDDLRNKNSNECLRKINKFIANRHIVNDIFLDNRVGTRFEDCTIDELTILTSKDWYELDNYLNKLINIKENHRCYKNKSECFYCFDQDNMYEYTLYNNQYICKNCLDEIIKSLKNMTIANSIVN